MYYYADHGHYYCALRDDLPFRKCMVTELAGQTPVFLLQRPFAACRGAFAVSEPGQLLMTAEDVSWLDLNQLPEAAEIPPDLRPFIAERRLRAVNYCHPRWRELATRRLPDLPRQKLRVNLLALGDVGSTLLIGLRLLGAGLLESIGICDLNETLARRWEFEINQIARPGEYAEMPRVEVITPEELFAGDVFVFCASQGLPPVGSQVKDVRMAQLTANAVIIRHYALQARQAEYRGLFAVVSDPVDPLCKTALLASNQGPGGEYDGLGLLPEQIQGYGLGVMNARAAYYAAREARFASFLSEGRAYGPHGADLVIANSLTRYDEALSRDLTELAVKANLEMRAWGFKPYVAPALSSGALAILQTLAGEWHLSSSYLGGVYMGAKNRYTKAGLEVATEPLPPALFSRIHEAAEHLAAIV